MTNTTFAVGGDIEVRRGLRRLRLDLVGLYQLHTPDPAVAEPGRRVASSRTIKAVAAAPARSEPEYHPRWAR